MEYSILNKINNPQDLKLLSMEALKKLCDEIRNKIIEVVSENGGHLASNLGTVELAVALHYVFNSPYDKIIWDTGHQAYPHKLLTGRAKAFHTLRKFGGIGPFLSIEESEHDIFGAGHAATSISAGLGFAIARDLKNEKNKVVVVVNDGSLSSGVAFEGLQNAGASRTDIIIVLNDNQIFISHRVGAFGVFLTKLLTLGIANRAQKKLEKLLARIKIFGGGWLRIAKRLKVILFPGVLFEELGFAYFGPVDGHNLPQLIEVLNAVKKLDGPRVLHVVTKKGKGLKPAEEDPIKYHGITKMNPITGELIKLKDTKTFTDIFSETLIQLAENDEKIVAITAAMPEGTGLAKFRKIFPNRTFDVGIGESHAVIFAAGLAREGFKPVVAIYSTFLQRAFDQIIHDVALQKIPIIFAIDRAGVVGEDGPTHHGIFDLSYLRLIPNIVIIVPKDENELRHALKTALNLNKPVAIRYPKSEVIGVSLDSELKLLPIGKPEVVSDGKYIAVITNGPFVYTALKAKEESNLDFKIINLRFLKPIDKETLLNELNDIKYVITCEDNTIIGGLGSAICEILAGSIPVKMLGILDTFIPHGKRDELNLMYSVSSRKIIEEIEKIKNENKTTWRLV
ncbi:MAG: 1-deoxy-D-xylulose-5-phosphate synthase [bacterium]|nr:1-deoxy-D-xylulose-5-phosphate synthase [bacterium]